MKNQSLEERLAVLEKEKIEQTEICAQIQQNLIQKTSEYEAQIRDMQMELDSRIDELDVTKKVDVEKVKNHYFELFHEKASELNTVRIELEKREEDLSMFKTRCKDLEYREQELSDMVDKIRSNHSASKGDSDTQKKIDEYTEENTQLKENIIKIRRHFDDLKEREGEIVSMFEIRSEEMIALLSEKDDQIMKLTSVIGACRPETKDCNTLPKSSQYQLEPSIQNSQELNGDSASLLNGIPAHNQKKKKKKKGAKSKM